MKIKVPADRKISPGLKHHLRSTYFGSELPIKTIQRCFGGILISSSSSWRLASVNIGRRRVSFLLFRLVGYLKIALFIIFCYRLEGAAFKIIDRLVDISRWGYIHDTSTRRGLRQARSARGAAPSTFFTSDIHEASTFLHLAEADIWIELYHFIIKMAEVIGVVSGAITFATVIAQVSNAIITIKDSWSQFRDAPDDLQYLMRDLELFRLILAEIEEDLSQKDLAFALKDSKHAMQSLQFSKEAATSLQALSEEFLRDMHCSSRLRKSYAAAKAVMQRGKLEKHLARLRNAIQWLSLSQQCYTRYLMTFLLQSYYILIQLERLYASNQI